MSGGLQYLARLPARTSRRPVRNIMISTKTIDEPLATAILEVAAGDRTEWTLADWRELEASLASDRTPLDAWLASRTSQ